jgi:hypothetical protein
MTNVEMGVAGSILGGIVGGVTGLVVGLIAHASMLDLSVGIGLAGVISGWFLGRSAGEDHWK